MKRLVLVAFLFAIPAQAAELGTLVLTVAGVFGLLTAFVMPKFESILRDFKIPMPATTRWRPPGGRP